MRAEDRADTPQEHASRGLRDNPARRRRARSIQAPLHRRTIDSKPSHFGFDYCADCRGRAANGEPRVAAFVRRESPTQLCIYVTNHGRGHACFDMARTGPCVGDAATRAEALARNGESMLPDFRFVIGAGLATAFLGVTSVGLLATVRLTHQGKVGPLEFLAHAGFRSRRLEPVRRSRERAALRRAGAQGRRRGARGATGFGSADERAAGRGASAYRGARL